MAGCLGNVLRGSHVTEPAPKDHVVSPDAYTELRSVMAGKPGSCIRKKNPGHYVTGVLFFRSLAPLRAKALEPAARRARVVRLGTKPNYWLCLLRAHPTLSWGTPCERTHQPINEKGPH